MVMLIDTNLVDKTSRFLTKIQCINILYLYLMEVEEEVTKASLVLFHYLRVFEVRSHKIPTEIFELIYNK